MSNENTGEKIVSGMFWRFGEKITAQVVSFIVSIVLARILMPEDYGVVAIVNVFIAIAEVFVTSGLGTALIQKKDATQLDFSTLFWCNMALSCLLYLMMFFLSPVIADFYDMPLLTPVLRVFSLRLPICAFNSIQNAYVSRRMDFKKFFFSTLIGTVISAVIGIVMALKGFGVWALVAQYLSNAVIDTLVLFITVGWRPHFEFSGKAAGPLVSYGWKILATDLIGTAFNQLNSFIIGKKYTSEDLAYYSQGKKIPDLLNTNISATLTAVLFPAMSLTENREEIIAIRRKSLKMLAYVLFPMMFGMIVVADNMVITLLTEKWILAVPFVRIACLEAILGVMGTTLIQEIKAIGRSDITLKLELIKKPVYLVIVVAAMFFGVKAIAWTGVLISVIAFFINVIPVKKYIGFDFKMHFLDAWPALWMSAVMCAAVYGVGYLVPNTLWCLVVQVLLGAAIYIGLSMVTKNESLQYLIGMLKTKMHIGQNK